MLENATNIIEGCIALQHKDQKIIYEHFRGYALNIVYRYIFRYDQAIDVVNDGFVKLFKNFPKFELCNTGDNQYMLMAWLKKIMINTSIDALRKNKMKMETGPIPEDIWDLTDKTYNADQLLGFKELVILIKKLPPDYRIVFNLYVVDGYTHSEVAALLKISEGTSKSTLSRARTLLKKSLNATENKLCKS